MEEQRTQQAFGSPGGKSYLAPRIVDMMPPHKTYVEPYAGGAAVFFRKPPSEREVLNDKDSEIAFAFRFLRDMTPEQYKRLEKKQWKVSRATFERVKRAKPQDDIERFYKFYYLKKASFGYGNAALNHNKENETIATKHLWKVHDRLGRVGVHGNNALALIGKYDSSQTFFYLDPPYPDRAFVGRTFKDWTEQDLQQLVERLKGIKGKFALSLGVEHARLLPKGWNIHRLKVARRIVPLGREWNQAYQYEIVATNFKPQKKRRAIRKRRPATPSLAGMRG